MNQCQMLHETILRDIVDVINDVKDFDQVEWIRNKNGTGSIAKRASNLVLVFPVIVSNTLSIQSASIISKAIERKCVSLLRILFSSINLTKAKDLQGYISQFHTNLNNNLSLDDFINVIDKMSESGEIDIIDRDMYEAVKEDMHNINFHLNESFNPVSINNYSSRSDLYGNSNIVLKSVQSNNDQNINEDYDYVDVKSLAKNVANIAKKVSKDTANSIVDSRKKELNNQPSTKDSIDYFRYQLLPQDVEKANELMPTMVAVNYTTYDNNDLKHSQTGIIGVKAKLYPVDAMDIVSRISSKYKDSNSLFNLIRASTREISFFKDFAFAIEKAKVDAINMARESNNAKIFKLLERRAAKNRFSSLLKKNDASPITSLVISQNEVEYLKKYNSIDIDKPYVTRSILEAYNLMDIVIADESLEIAKFLFDDGDGIYETLTFDSLEKEAKDSSYKKVINLMSKLNR